MYTNIDKSGHVESFVYDLTIGFYKMENDRGINNYGYERLKTNRK